MATFTIPCPSACAAAPHERTVADLLTAYMQEYLPTQAQHTQVCKTRFYRRLSAELGTMPLQEITPAFLRQWKADLLRRVSPGSARVYMQRLSAALTVAVDDYEWLPSHPMRKVKFPPEPSARDRPLTAAELPPLLAACEQSGHPALYPLVMLALATGRRKDELRCLQGPQVDLVQGVLRLRTTKNKHAYVVPVVGIALEVLRRWCATLPTPARWIFPGRDGQKPAFIDDAWRRARHAAGLDDLHFHDLRHSCGTFLAMSGATLADIKEILGHTDIKMTLRYIHLMPAHTHGVLERMAQQFLPPPQDGGMHVAPDTE